LANYKHAPSLAVRRGTILASILWLGDAADGNAVGEAARQQEARLYGALDDRSGRGSQEWNRYFSPANSLNLMRNNTRLRAAVRYKFDQMISFFAGFGR